MSNFGATCRNCLLSFWSVCEPAESSEMNCIGLLENETWRMRLRVSAKFVPRCGVERKTMAEMDLTIAPYAGSF